MDVITSVGRVAGAEEGRRQKVTVSEIRGGKIMTSGKTEVEKSR